MFDLKQRQTAFLLQWVGRLFQAQALDKWSHVVVFINTHAHAYVHTPLQSTEIM